MWQLTLIKVNLKFLFFSSYVFALSSFFPFLYTLILLQENCCVAAEKKEDHEHCDMKCKMLQEY